MVRARDEMKIANVQTHGTVLICLCIIVTDCYQRSSVIDKQWSEWCALAVTTPCPVPFLSWMRFLLHHCNDHAQYCCWVKCNVETVYCTFADIYFWLLVESGRMSSNLWRPTIISAEWKMRSQAEVKYRFLCCKCSEISFVCFVFRNA